VSSAGAVAELDRLLGEWDRRIERMDENLFALEEEPTYRTMIDPPTRGRLSGETREVIERAAETLAELFVDRDRLRRVVEEAREQRKEIGFFGDDARVEAIRQLLYGASIVIDRRATTLGARTLLGSSAVEDTVTPSALVTRMASGFEKARRDIAEMGTAWHEVEIELASLEEQARGLVDHASPDVGDMRAEVARLRSELVTDPLGARARVRAAASRLRDLRVRLDDEVARGDRVRARLMQSSERLQLLRSTLAGAPPPLPLRLAALDDLAVWRERLEVTVREGRLQPAAIGLERWHAALDLELAEVVRAIEQARADLARCDELRGRLSARRAQASALLARSPCSPAAVAATREQLDELARVAAAVLAESPVPLDRLEESVAAYERAVTTLARG
jgi:hypothetical protein